MEEKKIVCWENVLRYYGDNPELVKKYKKMIEKGECSFCPDSIREEFKFRFVKRTEYWDIVLNNYPYKNSELHLLIIPRRHVISISELTFEEWSQLGRVIVDIKDKYPILSKGYGLALRVEEVGGVTLYHLHWHLIVPEVDQEMGHQIPVNFGIG